jgi:L-threonylcarbamoyladenylate synthase
MPTRPTGSSLPAGATPAPLASPGAGGGALAEALGVLQGAPGGIVLAPTDTMWAMLTTGDVAGRARLVAARAALGTQSVAGARPVATWHASDADGARQALAPVRPIEARAIERLWPGPVTLQVERTPARLAEALARAGLAPGAADDGQSLFVRVPAEGLAARLARQVRGALVAEGVADAELAQRALTGAGVQCSVLRDAPGMAAPPGVRSALVRLPARGGFVVVREGALSAQQIARRLTVRVLLVCTGNTCRSPMAWAIAKDLIERQPAGSLPIEVDSAGTSAGVGDRPTPEGLEALRLAGILARPLPSKPVTAALLQGADVVLAMTRGHLRTLAQIDPAGARALLLDPDGDEVPDPIGGPLESYRQTAGALAGMLRRRIETLGSGGVLGA